MFCSTETAGYCQVFQKEIQCRYSLGLLHIDSEALILDLRDLLRIGRGSLSRPRVKGCRLAVQGGFRGCSCSLLCFGCAKQVLWTRPQVQPRRKLQETISCRKPCLFARILDPKASMLCMSGISSEPIMTSNESKHRLYSRQKPSRNQKPRGKIGLPIKAPNPKLQHLQVTHARLAYLNPWRFFPAGCCVA